MSYWFYCAVYGSYHWLCAIQYFMTSVTLPLLYNEAQIIKNAQDEQDKILEAATSRTKSIQTSVYNSTDLLSLNDSEFKENRKKLQKSRCVIKAINFVCLTIMLIVAPLLGIKLGSDTKTYFYEA